MDYKAPVKWVIKGEGKLIDASPTEAIISNPNVLE
jgi:hypothetical protein